MGTERCSDGCDGVRVGYAFRRACVQEEGVRRKHSLQPRTKTKLEPPHRPCSSFHRFNRR